ncbi:MAG: hypothetical protein U0232_08785 [Thermomicrobiales bacterium]
MQGAADRGRLAVAYVLVTPLLPTTAFLLVYVAIGVTVAGKVIGWMNLLLDVADSAATVVHQPARHAAPAANLLPLVGGGNSHGGAV